MRGPGSEDLAMQEPWWTINGVLFGLLLMVAAFWAPTGDLFFWVAGLILTGGALIGAVIRRWSW